MRNILSDHTNKISELKLIPSAGGVLEVTLNDELVFSKKQLDRYPEKREIEDIISQKLV